MDNLGSGLDGGDEQGIGVRSGGRRHPQAGEEEGGSTLDSWLGQGDAAKGEVAFSHSGSRLGGRSWGSCIQPPTLQICTVNA